MKITGSAGLYTVRNDDGSIAIKFDYMRLERNAVHARVRVISDAVAGGPNLFSTKINISGPNGRRDVGNYLIKNYGDTYPWPKIISNSCIMVEDRYLEGEPAIDFSEFVPSGTVGQYLVDPYLPLNSPSVIFAPGASGKSYWAAFLLALVQSGMSLPWLPVSEQRNGMYLDYESTPDDVYERMDEVCRGLGIGNMPAITYRRCYQPLSHDLQEIKRTIHDNNIGFIVVDSAGPASGGHAADEDASLQFFLALRSLNVTSLVLAHTAKNAIGDPKPYGSVHWENQPRSVWTIKHDQEEDEPKFRLDLIHTKVNRGRRLAPRALEFSFEQEGQVYVKRIDRKSVEGFVENMPTGTRIELMLVMQGKMTLAQIQAYLDDLTMPAVKSALTRGKKDGRFVSLPGGYWAASDKLSADTPNYNLSEEDRQQEDEYFN